LRLLWAHYSLAGPRRRRPKPPRNSRLAPSLGTQKS